MFRLFPIVLLSLMAALPPLLLPAPATAQGPEPGAAENRRPGDGGLVPAPGAFGPRPGTAASREFDRNNGTNFSGAYPLRNDNGFAAEGWRRGGAIRGNPRGGTAARNGFPDR